MVKPFVRAFQVLSIVSTLSSPTLISAQNSVHFDWPSPYGDEYAPDVIVADGAVHGALVSEVPATEGDLVPDLTVDVNGTEHEGDAWWGIDRRAAEFYLRIMPLGASITQGINSGDGNGYRKHIRDQLRYAGWLVNMVGSKQDGNMADRVQN